MVFCIVGLVVFAVLGIFSAKYRAYFRESLHCMRRHLLLKPCDTQFDQQMKAKITAKLSRVPRLSRFVYRRFVLISWILLILMIISTVLVGLGIYNFVLYGNCNGPDSSDFCFFGLLNQRDASKITPLGVGDSPTIGSLSAPVKILELGCYSCPYTKDAESIRSQLLTKYGSNISFTFRDMPVPAHPLSFERGEAASCANDQGRFWEYHDLLFRYQDQITVQKFFEIASEIGLNLTEFEDCYTSGKYREKIRREYDEGVAAGIYATPTYFINGRPFVGLKAFADFEQIVVGDISGACSV